MDEPVDPLGAGRTEEVDLCARKVGLPEDPVPNGIVDVVVDVGDPIDEAHDPPLERLRFLLAGVREDPVADLMGQVEPARDPPRLLVVPEVPPKLRVERSVEGLLTGMAERRVTRVVPEADRLDEILVELKRPRDDP